jgi:hypothetical protein
LDRIHLPLVKRHPVRSHLSKLALKCKNADITPRSRGHHANAARTSATRWAAQSSARALATQRDQPGGQSRTRNRLTVCRSLFGPEPRLLSRSGCSVVRQRGCRVAVRLVTRVGRAARVWCRR